MDKFRINATIFGNEIESGFNMPEDLVKEDYAVVFANRLTKCINAFSQAVVKVLMEEK